VIEALKSILKQAAHAHQHEDPAEEADRLALEQAALAAKADEITAHAEELMTSARASRNRGDRIGASIIYAEAITLLRANNNTPKQLAYALRHAADVRSQLKEYAAAGVHIEEAIRLYRALVLSEEATPLDLANALRVAALNGEREAHALWREARDLYTESKITAGTDECTERLECLKHHNEVSKKLQEPAA
jgi:tetratricopeptide (TPR) repeat protein